MLATFCNNARRRDFGGLYNGDTYGSAYDDKNGIFNVTLLRSPIYSAHPVGEMGNVPQDRYCKHIDLSEHFFRFALEVSETSAIEAGAARGAAAFNDLPMSLSFYPNGYGSIPQAGLHVYAAVIL